MRELSTQFDEAFAAFEAALATAATQVAQAIAAAIAAFVAADVALLQAVRKHGYDLDEWPCIAEAERRQAEG